MSSMVFLVAVVLGVVWFLMFIILKRIAVRRAVAVKRSSSIDLWTSMAWLLESGRPWSRVGRFCICWLFCFPFAWLGSIIFLQWALQTQ